MVLQQSPIWGVKRNFNACLEPFTKVNLRWAQGLNVKKQKKLLEGNTGENLTFILGQVNISWNPEITQHKNIFKWINWIPSELKLLLIPQVEKGKSETRRKYSWDTSLTRDCIQNKWRSLPKLWEKRQTAQLQKWTEDFSRHVTEESRWMTKSQRHNGQHLESSGKCQLPSGSSLHPPTDRLQRRKKGSAKCWWGSARCRWDRETCLENWHFLIQLGLGSSTFRY